MIKNVLFSLLPTMICLMMAELISSFFSPQSSIFWDNPMMLQYPVERFDPNITREKLHFNADPDRLVRYVPDPIRWYRLEPEPPIPSTGKLILHFGDSSTWGWGLPHRRYAYPAVLNDFLPPTVRSINLGIPGYSSLQGLKYLEIMLPLYHKRLIAVTIYFGNNDATENGMPDHQRLELVKRKSFLANMHSWFDQHSAFYRIARTCMTKINVNNNSAPRVSPDEYRANIQNIINLCRQHGVKVILIEPPVHFLWKPGYLTHIRSLENDVCNKWVLNALLRAQTLYQQGVALVNNRDDGYELFFRDAVEHDWIMSRVKKEWRAILREFNAQTDLIRVPTAFVEAEYPYYFIDYCHPTAYVHGLIARDIAHKLELPNLSLTGG